MNRTISTNLADLARDSGNPNFDRIALVYRWMEWLSFGPCLARCRRAFLADLGQARHALVLGDGDGRFTGALLRANAEVQIEALDISPAMLDRLRHRAGADAARLCTRVTDVRRWTPPQIPAFDLVVTHFFLDCFTAEEVGTLASRLRWCVLPNARWIVSEFAIPPGFYGRIVARPVVAFLYAAFRLLTGLRVRRLPNFESEMKNAGFMLKENRRSLGGLLVSQDWTVGSGS